MTSYLQRHPSVVYQDSKTHLQTNIHGEMKGSSQRTSSMSDTTLCHLPAFTDKQLATSDFEHFGDNRLDDALCTQELTSLKSPYQTHHAEAQNVAIDEEQSVEEHSATIGDPLITNSELDDGSKRIVYAAEEADDHNCDDVSTASTLQYHNHEPFEDFQHKVMVLCESLWPEHVGNITVEKMHGGSFNRIIGINIEVDSPAKPNWNAEVAASGLFFQFLKTAKDIMTYLKIIQSTVLETRETTRLQYILRIPRQQENHNIRYQADLFEFANRLSDSFAVPTAIHIDTTSDNPLSSPYIIQNRISGTCLAELWSELNQQHKMSLGTQMGKLFYEISKHQYSAAGIIDPASVSNKDTDSIRIFEHEYKRRVKCEPLETGGLNWKEVTENPKVPASGRRTALEILRANFQKWKEWKCDPEYPDEEIEPYTKLFRVATEQQDDYSTWSPERRFYIAHNDLYPRNIMARIINDHKVEVTGILDWDLVTITPAVIAFQPPWWLWKHEKYLALQENYHPLAIREPKYYAASTFEEQQIRAAFETRAGFEVTKYACNPNSHLAKMLWQWSINGIGNSGLLLSIEVVEQKGENWSSSDDSDDSDSDSDSDDCDGEEEIDVDCDVGK
jgi:aminoglycoside phosphotransferase (APT) family kinase protein